MSQMLLNEKNHGPGLSSEDPCLGVEKELMTARLGVERLLHVDLDGVGEHRRHQTLLTFDEALLPQTREELTRKKRIRLDDRTDRSPREPLV